MTTASTKHLGGATTAMIGLGPIFRDGDVVGLGSGRSTDHTIDALRVYSTLRAQVALRAMTGQAHPPDHQSPLGDNS